MITRSIRVYGRVQGVFYRRFTHDQAIALGLTGEVKNKPDGSVHIIATGLPETLEQMANACRMGPPRAIISHLEITDLPLQSFVSFRILR